MKRATSQIHSRLSQAQLPLPSDASLQKIATVMEKQLKEENQTKKYAPVRAVLSLLGKGITLSSVILAPGTARAFAPLFADTPNYNAWKRFNPSYLRRTLKVLEKQKHVEVVTENGAEIVRLTHGGKRKILQYSLHTLSLDRPKSWDGKWRLVMYDIPTGQRHTRDVLRQTLQRLGFYKLQESVYLFPYPCFDEIEYLRQYYFLDITVQYLLVSAIENDGAYRTYFSLH